jgi:subtilase family serine protease
LYDHLYGLPDPKLKVLTPFGSLPPSTEDNGVSFDTETAHSIAPGAVLDVVLVDMHAGQTFNDQFTILVRAMKYAIDQDLGDIISISTGFGEGCLSSSSIQLEHRALQDARAKHITVLAEAGNDGNVVASCKGSQIIPVTGVNLPAADPLVTAVGGTSLDATNTGTYLSEGAWGQTSFDNHGVPTQNATGGGFSRLFPQPPYQRFIRGMNGSRGVPDVAFDADPRTGRPYVVNQQVLTDGSSAPSWAGIVALADQYAGRRLGFLNTGLYRILQNPVSYAQGFHDITTGNNAMTISGGGQTLIFPGYSAGPGWDAVSGLGTPKVAQLLPLLMRNCLANDGNAF